MIAARRLLVAGFALAFGLSQVQAQESASQPAAAPLPLNELRTFAEVFERIRSSYVEPVDDATLLENAIRGMLEGLRNAPPWEMNGRSCIFRKLWTRTPISRCMSGEADNPLLP